MSRAPIREYLREHKRKYCGSTAWFRGRMGWTIRLARSARGANREDRGIEMCQAYHRQHGNNFIPVMPANLYGAGDSFDIIPPHLRV